jgi:peptidyl-tRNA hydrolase, PTH1 family
VVGLGNPGEQFARTRHNVGAEAVALVVERRGGSLRALKGVRVRSAEVRIAEARVVLAVPTIYMNDAGEAVGPLVRRAGLEDPEGLVIVHDELDLEPGRVKVKVGGGLAGHNGLRSIQAHLHTSDFVRVRIGVGKPPSAAAGARYVLRPPRKAERQLLDDAVSVAADAVEVIAADGPEAAMNRFNG